MEVSSVLEQRFAAWLDQAPGPQLVIHVDGSPWTPETSADPVDPSGTTGPSAADDESPPDGARPARDEPTPEGPGPAQGEPTPEGPRAAQGEPTPEGPGPAQGEPDLAPTISELRDVGRDRSILDAAMLESVRATTAVTRGHVLERHGWTGIELNKTQTRTLHADTKRATITEVQHALGFTVTEATTLVSLAMTGRAVVTLAVEAMRRGEVTWAQVRRFWETSAAPSRDLSPEQRELVAQTLFGTKDSLAAVERFDENGNLRLGTPWAHSDFDAALEREATACEGADVDAERERRKRAHNSRKVRVRVHDDGTATLILRGPAISVLGVHDRYDNIARNLKGQGHEQPLAFLLVDTMLAVLGFGQLDLPDPGTLADLSPTALDDLIAVVNGAPRISMQVIVPFDALFHAPNPATPAGVDGSTGCGATAPTHTSAGTPAAAPAPTPTPTPTPDPTDPTPDRPEDNRKTRPGRGTQPAPRTDTEAAPRTDTEAATQRDTEAATQKDTEAAPRGGSDPETEETPREGRPFDDAHGPPPDWARPDPRPRSCNACSRHEETPFTTRPGQIGYDSRLRRGRGLVAEVRGTYPFFITAGQARELFFSPGTTLHRLVTDTLDGRLVERTITTYRPDTDMRRQVKAADVYSRAPFSRLSGRSLEIDHVIPYGTDPGGVTSELNLADLDKRNHKIKTIGDLRLAINERRDLTFTTLLGQVTRTRTHDYNQYLRAAHPDDLDEQRDLANRVLYALLAADPRYQHRPTKDAWLTIDHTDPDGQRRPGPPPHPENAHALLGITDDDQPDDDQPDDA